MVRIIVSGGNERLEIRRIGIVDGIADERSGCIVRMRRATTLHRHAGGVNKGMVGIVNARCIGVVGIVYMQHAGIYISAIYPSRTVQGRLNTVVGSFQPKGVVQFLHDFPNDQFLVLIPIRSTILFMEQSGGKQIQRNIHLPALLKIGRLGECTVLLFFRKRHYPKGVRILDVGAFGIFMPFPSPPG